MGWLILTYYLCLLGSLEFLGLYPLLAPVTFNKLNKLNLVVNFFLRFCIFLRDCQNIFFFLHVLELLNLRTLAFLAK